MPIEQLHESARLLEVLDRVLDKGIVVDAWRRVSLVGLDLLAVDVRMIVASFDTYVVHMAQPAPSAPVARPAAPESPAARLAGQLILLVEDHPESREAVQRLLELEGARVVAAADGPGALEQLASLIPDVLLIDLGLPGMDGFELLATVHRNPAWSRIPAIAVTARVMPADYHATLEAGFEAHVQKPLDPERLIRAVERARRAVPASMRRGVRPAARRGRPRKLA
jgi:CheY-like chemotaxis protein